MIPIIRRLIRDWFSEPPSEGLISALVEVAKSPDFVLMATVGVVIGSGAGVVPTTSVVSGSAALVVVSSNS